MANAIEDITLGLQKEWFNQALAQQKAVYEATLKMWSRLFAVPRVIDWARDVKVGTTPSEIVYEEDSLRLLRYRRDTPAVYAEPDPGLLRPGQPALHRRPASPTGA